MTRPNHVPLTIWEKLRLPQKEAAIRMFEYLLVSQTSETQSSALVRMPTGSGKTGVVACLSQFIQGSKHIIIVTPRIALVDQLTKEVNGNFFKTLGYSASLPREVDSLDSVTKHKGGGKVFIDTIHKLHYLSKSNIQEYLSLVANTGLIIFDEGHYEPSASWSVTIRKFNCPKILFTATPFRNDFKTFDINPQYEYNYSFHRGIQENIIRDVEVIERPPKTSPKRFIEDVLQEFNKIKNQVSSDARIIIRCDDADNILKICKVLEQQGLDYIAIHENFTPDKGGKRFKHVPDPKTINALIWIHQYKLIEGIDEPRFHVLAVFNEFFNARQLIQQIGRITRNNDQDPKSRAFFIDHSIDHQQAELWKNYLEFEAALDSNAGKGAVEVFVHNLKQLPVSDYIAGKFRKRFDLEQPLAFASKQIKLPYKCNFIEIDASFNLSEFIAQQERRFKQNDLRFQRHNLPLENATVFIYMQLSNSEYLQKDYFINASLNVMVFKVYANKYIAFYDSLNYLPSNDPTIRTGLPISPEKLRKLISADADSRLTNVSLKNSNLGSGAIRRHGYSAASLNETVPFLDDHAQIISSLYGYSKEDDMKSPGNQINKTRYLGFNKGRIAEGGTFVTLEIYFKWISFIYDILQSARRPNEIFKRYSVEKKSIKKTEPRHILLDFSEVEHLKYRPTTVGDEGNEKTELAVFENLASEISYDQSTGRHLFQIKEKHKNLNFGILFDSVKRKYILDSDDTRGAYWAEEKDLVAHLNQTQAFRVIPDETNTIYIDGRFYNPAIKTGSEFDEKSFQLGKIITGVDFLRDNGSEKGRQCRADHSGWEPDSLFDFIHHLGLGSNLTKDFGSPDYLICDDLGTECSDFILSDADRVVFIHAKGNGNEISHCSASKLMEICGQATKNIRYLSMFNDIPPKHLNRWTKEWKDTAHTNGHVKSRLLIGTGEPKAIWEKLHERIRHPLKTKEVWLVLGRLLSRSRLIDELQKTKPTHEAVQAAILLHGTMTNVSSINARLKIFCHP